MNILMAVKDKVLAALEQARGERLSGGRLAETLGVSRAAVHKAISTLRADGLAIDCVPGEGYRCFRPGASAGKSSSCPPSPRPTRS